MLQKTNPVRKKEPMAVDVHIGRRIKARRMELGLSQEKLGDHIGLTFQQVQKYEKGMNRVGGSRLHQIAEALRCTPAYFYEGLDATGQPVDTDREALLATMECRDLLAAFASIKSVKVRRQVVHLVSVLAGETNAPSN